MARIVFRVSDGAKRASDARRGRIYEFTRKSRKRLMRKVNSIDRRACPAEGVWFVTLTLPGVDPSMDPEDWRRWMKALRKRIERKWGRMPIIWKLEFQTRGAAHWHLLVCVPEELRGHLRGFRAWLSQAWFEVVGSGQVDHLRAGTGVEPVRSWRGVTSYAAKYLGKEVPQMVNEETGEAISPGRFWGVWWEELLPVSWRAQLLPWECLFQIRRQLRRYARRPGQGRLWAFEVFVPSGVLERLIEWAT